MQQQDLLLELEQDIFLEPVKAGARFANYIIDLIAFYIAIVAIGALISRFSSSSINYILGSDDNSISATITGYLISWSIYVIYYTLLEGATKGKTLGKIITGTKAVKEDASPFTWNDALVRSLCRIVPFEPFSAFGESPWHDRWTKTTVVKQN